MRRAQERAAAADDVRVTQPPSPHDPPAPYGAPPGSAPPPAPPASPAPPGAFGLPAGYVPPPRQTSYLEQPPAAAPPLDYPPAAPFDPTAPGAYDPAAAAAAWAEPSDPAGAGGPDDPDAPRKRASAWNGPAFGMLAIVAVLLGVFVVWPQARARIAERKVHPLVQALAHRDAGARCPRYITAVFTNVGSVRLDERGRIADRTDLTGPICDGLRHFYSGGGTRELSCLTSGSTCSEGALRSVVVLSVVAHESMHLRGQLNEGGAECDSIGESQTLSTTLGLSLQQARMISYLHWAAMNPYTPPQYRVLPSNCQAAADLVNDPPGEAGAREALTAQVAATWMDLAT